MSTTRAAPFLTRRAAGQPGFVAMWLLALWVLSLPACRKPPPPDDSRGAAQRAEQAEEQKALEARRRQSVENLRLVARGLADYAVERRHLLPAAICDRTTGQQLLSWRVALLPYIKQEALYRQFRLDEPWDGPNNTKLLEKMPRAYAAPGADPAPGTMTRYRGLIAAPGSPVRTAWATLADKEAPLGFWGGRFPAPFEDGTSNTIAVVEAAEAVPWTRPGELDYDPKKPLPRLGGLFPDGLHAGMADGAVLFIRTEVKEADLRGLITANGREPVDVGGLMDKGLIRVPGRLSE